MSIKLQEFPSPRGYVTYELIDDKTNKLLEHGKGYGIRWYNSIPVLKFILNLFPSWFPIDFSLGKENAIVNFAREELADFMQGDTITVPQFVAVGTGTTEPTASDTGMETLSQYDGANDAKQAASRSKQGRFTARIITQFLTSEANITIRELGLFDAANSGNMWARVSVNITKDSTQRLNVYWYFTFERRTSLAIKTGGSIGATGTINSGAASTITFANAVTVVTVHNNTGGVVYISINDALDAGTPPTSYDYSLADGERIELLNEEISITTMSVYKVAAGNITLPDNEFVARGW